jgi:hypothetical protein
MRYGPGKEPIMVTYPELHEYREFIGMSDAELKYLMFRYDPGCEEVQKHPEDQKNYVAANLAGIPADWADTLSGGDVEPFAVALTRLFRIMNSRQWEIYVSGEMALNEMLRKVREKIKEGLDEDRELKAYQLKTELYKKAMEMMKEQDKILKDMAGDGSVMVGKVVSKDPEKMVLSAEAMARRGK